MLGRTEEGLSASSPPGSPGRAAFAPQSGIDRWRGRVAVVTGANSGIGNAICQRLLELGLTVAALDREIEQLQILAMSTVGGGVGTGGRLHPVQCNLHVEEEVLATFAWVDRALGGTQALVNCAGVFGEADILGGTPADWRRVLDVNVVALCLCCREAVRSMRRKRLRDGIIINIGSAVSSEGGAAPSLAGWSLHEASKAAVHALSASLRRELRALRCPARVALLRPGRVRGTRLVADARGAAAHALAFAAGTPTLAPEDVAHAVAFVLAQPPAVQIEELVITPSVVEAPPEPRAELMSPEPTERPRSPLPSPRVPRD